MKLRLILLVAVVFAHHSFGGMVSYLRFEENTGTTAHDETGLMDGDMLGIWGGSEGWSTDVPVSTIPQTGEANTSSIRFGGGSEYIDMSNYNDLLLGYSFTIEMFIKPDENAAQYGASIFGFGSDYSDKLFFSISISSGQSYFTSQFMDTQVYFLAEEIRFNEWQHVALVKEQGEYSVYLDGQLLHNEGLSSALDGPYEFYGDPTIGTRTIGTFRGWIDEFRISDTALTPDQFLGAYGIPEPGTIALLLLGIPVLGFARRRLRNPKP